MGKTWPRDNTGPGSNVPAWWIAGQPLLMSSLHPNTWVFYWWVLVFLFNSNYMISLRINMSNIKHDLKNMCLTVKYWPYINSFQSDFNLKILNYLKQDLCNGCTDLQLGRSFKNFILLKHMPFTGDPPHRFFAVFSFLILLTRLKMFIIFILKGDNKV